MLTTYYFFAHAAAFAARIFHRDHRLHLTLTPCRRACRCMCAVPNALHSKPELGQGSSASSRTGGVPPWVASRCLA
eukprot:14248638-Alexandrium_andersonii.AAC.1